MPLLPRASSRPAAAEPGPTMLLDPLRAWGTINIDGISPNYILNARGEHAGVAMYATYRGRPLEYALSTENGPQTLPVEGLMGEAPIPF